MLTPDIEFTLPIWARGAHAQTIVAHLLNRPAPMAADSRLYVELADGARVVVYANHPTDAARSRGAVLIMHGLGSDGSADYVVNAGRHLLSRGWTVYRLNHRGAGPGAGLSHRMYNSGVSDDCREVIDHLAARHPGAPLTAVGYSMSGNILLKHLGEGPTSDRLVGAVAVNPPIELEACMDALERRRNTVYHLRFIRMLKAQLKANRDRVDEDIFESGMKARDIRDFDDRVTAPSWGYQGAADYYAQASARKVVDRITTPTLVLHADDDPFVPPDDILGADWPGSVTLEVTRGGGHMGYLAEGPTPLGDRRWLDWAVVQAVESFEKAV